MPTYEEELKRLLAEKRRQEGVAAFEASEGGRLQKMVKSAPVETEEVEPSVSAGKAFVRGVVPEELRGRALSKFSEELPGDIANPVAQGAGATAADLYNLAIGVLSGAAGKIPSAAKKAAETVVKKVGPELEGSIVPGASGRTGTPIVHRGAKFQEPAQGPADAVADAESRVATSRDPITGRRVFKELRDPWKSTPVEIDEWAGAPVKTPFVRSDKPVGQLAGGRTPQLSPKEQEIERIKKQISVLRDNAEEAPIKADLLTRLKELEKPVEPIAPGTGAGKHVFKEVVPGEAAPRVVPSSPQFRSSVRDPITGRRVYKEALDEMPPWIDPELDLRLGMANSDLERLVAEKSTSPTVRENAQKALTMRQELAKGTGGMEPRPLTEFVGEKSPPTLDRIPLKKGEFYAEKYEMPAVRSETGRLQKAEESWIVKDKDGNHVATIDLKLNPTEKGDVYSSDWTYYIDPETKGYLTKQEMGKIPANARGVISELRDNLVDLHGAITSDISGSTSHAALKSWSKRPDVSGVIPTRDYEPAVGAKAIDGRNWTKVLNKMKEAGYNVDEGQVAAWLQRHGGKAAIGSLTAPEIFKQIQAMEIVK